MKKTLFAIFVIALAFVFLSCATTAKKEGKAQSKGTAEEKAAKSKQKGAQEPSESVEALEREAQASMKKAKAAKADVALPGDFAKALAAYEKGAANKQEKNEKRAAENFRDAKSLFDSVYAETEELRARAQKSIEESNRELKSVEQKAKGADLS